jgi:hypothetical protein
VARFGRVRYQSVYPGIDLVLTCDGGELRQHKLLVYQPDGVTRREIAGRYAIEGRQVSFRLARYDARKPLVVDPKISYSTYLGSSSDKIVFDITIAVHAHLPNSRAKTEPRPSAPSRFSASMRLARCRRERTVPTGQVSETAFSDYSARAAAALGVEAMRAARQWQENFLGGLFGQCRRIRSWRRQIGKGEPDGGGKWP